METDQKSGTGDGSNIPCSLCRFGVFLSGGILFIRITAGRLLLPSLQE